MHFSIWFLYISFFSDQLTCKRRRRCPHRRNIDGSWHWQARIRWSPAGRPDSPCCWEASPQPGLPDHRWPSRSGTSDYPCRALEPLLPVCVWRSTVRCILEMSSSCRSKRSWTNGNPVDLRTFHSVSGKRPWSSAVHSRRPCFGARAKSGRWDRISPRVSSTFRRVSGPASADTRTRACSTAPAALDHDLRPVLKRK